MRFCLQILFISVLISFWSCSSDEEVPDTNIDEEIQAYIQANNLNAMETSSGLFYVVREAGSNEKPDINSTIIVHLVGRFLNGGQFQSTYDQGAPLVFPVADFIPGFREGVQLFGRGGDGQLIIHPDLAFGSTGSNTVPPNSVLIFDIEVIDFYNDVGEYNERLITAYLEENNIEAQRTQNGLYYVIDEPGIDPFPSNNSTVTADYHGYLLDGTVFDSSVERGMPLTISLNSVIDGWQEGLQLFGTGGKGTLFIPSTLAYGSAGSPPNIGPDTPIVFEIELISVQ